MSHVNHLAVKLHAGAEGTGINAIAVTKKEVEEFLHVVYFGAVFCCTIQGALRFQSAATSIKYKI